MWDSKYIEENKQRKVGLCGSFLVPTFHFHCGHKISPEEIYDSLNFLEVSAFSQIREALGKIFFYMRWLPFASSSKWSLCQNGVFWSGIFSSPTTHKRIVQKVRNIENRPEKKPNLLIIENTERKKQKQNKYYKLKVKQTFLKSKKLELHNERTQHIYDNIESTWGEPTQFPENYCSLKTKKQSLWATKQKEQSTD